MSDQSKAAKAAIKTSSKKATLAFGSFDGAIEKSSNSVKALQEQSLSAFTCNSCKHTTVAQSDLQPFCVTCGSHQVSKLSAKVEGAKVLSSTQESQLAAVSCGFCHHSTVVSRAHVASAGGKIHCVICGTKATVLSEAESETMQLNQEDVPQQDSMAIQESPLQPEAASENQDNELLEIQNASADEDGDEEDEDEDKETAKMTNPGWEKILKQKQAKKKAKADADETDPKDTDKDGDVDKDDDFGGEKAPPFGKKNAKASKEVKASDLDALDDSDFSNDGFEDIDDVSDDDFGEDGFDDGAPDDEDFIGADEVVDFDQSATDGLSPEEVIVDDTAIAAADTDIEDILDEMSVNSSFSDGDPLVDSLSMDDDAGDLSVFSNADTVVALKANVSIAVLSAKDAGKNANLMHSKAFATAVKSLADKEGVRASLQKLGFQPICVPTITESAMKKEVAKVTASAKAKSKTFLSSIEESLVLAAVGLARGQWKDRQDPMVANFIEVLAAYGMSGPKATRLAKDACGKASEQYAREVFSLANVLIEKGADFRKNVKAAFQLTVAAVDNEGTDLESDEVDEHHDLTSQLTAGFKPVVEDQQAVISRHNQNNVLAKELKFIS